MLDWLLDPFSGALMQRALAEVLIVAVACGPLGVWVLLYRQSYAAESISHAMLPGPRGRRRWRARRCCSGAAGGVIVAAVAIALAGRDERLGGDVGVAVAISALFGLGALLALSPDVPARLGELLFGDLLGVTGGDLVEAAVLAGARGRRARARAPAAGAERVRPRRRAVARRAARRAGSSRCSRCSRSARWRPCAGSATCSSSR